MAICSQRIGLSGFGKFDSVKNTRTNHLIVKVRAFQSSRNGVMGNSLNEAAFGTSSLYGRCTERKEKHGFRVWNSLQPNMGPEASKSSVVSPVVSKDEGKDGVSVKDVDDSGGVRVNPVADNGNGGAGNGKAGGGGGGNGGGGGGGENEENDREGEEFGPIMKFEEVMKEVEKRGASLPADMLEAAKTVGIREVLLLRYLDMQGSAWPIGFLMRSCAMLRNRMLADPAFLFKVGTEIVIDSCCATFAEVQKRGKDFWAEFELYVADLLVGIVVNIALVGMLAPYVRIGQASASQGLFGRMQHAYAALPSSVFEVERPGCRFSVQQRIATYFYKGLMYGAVGFGCGLVGQGIANFIMTTKRSINKSEEDIPVPPLIKSAALWGVFLAVSSNTRYQVVNLLERLVETSPVGKRVPQAALGFTVGIRFANNVYAGMQFVDWARWSGCQ
ncbi:hypothetical protein MKW94_030084 [Papaver nudicaule]|uniref:Uncharacterized protein n=1 Tax=Papaver nudicaule TaxID=74823 RepID=A0AA41VSU9_PAPNU|nr:hypothetical protein [Papaver nudicaule]